MSAPIGEELLAETAEAAMRVGADGIQVLAFHSWGGLTRFASSRIHQNTWREDVEFRVMAVVDGNRTGVASTHSVDPSAFPGLAPPSPVATAIPFDEDTADAAPALRAAAVASVLGEFPKGMEGAGYVETVADEVLVCSTTGLRAFGRTTRAGVSVLAIAEDSSGYAERLERRFGDLEPRALAAKAVDKAERSRNPQPIEPGAYTVILEPAATSTIMQFLGYLGFGAKPFLEGRSFMSGKIGQKLLIDRGVATGVVWDRATAAKESRESTGHALPPPNPYGPMPLNLRMEPGTSSVEDMVAGTERGLLVTRFHYSNVVNEKETILTGMTRDGTFLIKDGRLARGVKNLRYTQNALEALAAVEAVGDRTEISTELFFGGSRAPALKIRDFKFSSSTTH